MENKALLKDCCDQMGVSLTESQLEQFMTYLSLLLEWNEKMNLTAITEHRDVVLKHFADCLSLIPHVEWKEGMQVIDVGTGAGFPGMVLKIARPDINLTLLDGLNKRLIFLADVLEKTGLTAELVHARAEEGGKNVKYREQFDFSCARAVANLPVLSEYCIPFVKKGGYFVALKGATASEEAQNALNAYKILGCEKPTIICETLTGNEKRAFVIAKKISQTPTKYPRHGNKISKSAL